jgi:hypothetical protein
MLFFPSSKYETDLFKKVVALPNVTYKILEDAKTQIEASEPAKIYAKEHGAKFLPIGLDFDEYRAELQKVVAAVNIEAPEIWVLGGSGNLARALHAAYPNIPVKVVNLGTANGYFADLQVYDAPEKLDEVAEIPPPYTSAPNYDAKVWRFVLQHAKPGAFIWNVA